MSAWHWPMGAWRRATFQRYKFLLFLHRKAGGIAATAAATTTVTIAARTAARITSAVFGSTFWCLNANQVRSTINALMVLDDAFDVDRARTSEVM